MRFNYEDCDMEIEFHETGWAEIHSDEGCISLGCYPNKRWDIIEQALNYAKSQKVNL